MAPLATLIRQSLDIKLYEESGKQYLTVADIAKILKVTLVTLTPLVNSAPNNPKTLLDVPGLGDTDCISNEKLPGLLSSIARPPSSSNLISSAVDLLRSLSRKNFSLTSFVESYAGSVVSFTPAPNANSGGGGVSFDIETLDDRVAALIQVAGSLTKNYDDANGILTLTGTPISLPFSTTPTLTNLMTVSRHIVTAPLNFTTPINGIAGATAYVRLVADGVLANTPTFAGFAEAQGNLGYDSTAGAVNLVKFFFDGLTYWYSILGAVGATAAPMPIQTLTNFRTNTAGTQLLFDNAGTALTALVGTLQADTSRTLTFVSATVASISGAAITNAQTGLTATLTSATPAIPVAVTGVAVTNAVPGALLAKQTIAYGATPVVTRTGDAISFTGAGASVVTPINTANPFEVIVKSGKAADVFIFDGVIASTYAWSPPLSSVKFGGYYANANLQATSSTVLAEIVATGGQASTSYLKYRKSGNDVVMSSSANGTTYTDVKTFAGVLSGLSTVYLNIYNVGGGTCAPEVSFYA